MKIPIVNLGDATTDVSGSLPAVAQVRASGFLSITCPVLRGGTKRAWRLMLLVSHEARMILARSMKEAKPPQLSTVDGRDGLVRCDSAPSGFGAVAVDGNGRAKP